MTGWTPALRIARRELLRARGRTVLVLLMVLLPVTAVVALSTLLHTSEIDAREGLPASLGGSSARLDVQTGRVEQSPDLRSVGQYDAVPRATEADVRDLLPAGSRLLPVRETYDPFLLRAGERGLRVARTAVDLRDARLRGPYALLDGTAPDSATEVAVTPRLRDRGVRVGDVVDLAGEARTVTAVVRPPRDSDGSSVLGLPEAVGLADAPVTRWFSEGPPVEWDDVLALNEIGVLVLSREVVLDPPPAEQVPTQAYDDGQDIALVTAGLIAVMAVLEVVLLAGPAFAVGARRQRRSLALMAAGGAAPAQVRRVVLAQGLLLGGAAGCVGVPLGVAIAAGARAPLTRWFEAQWGPFDIAPGELVLVALLGAGTALLAALAPAVVMARQPIVAALTGRRLTSAGAARPAALGLVLLVVGVTITLGAVRNPFRFGGYSELGVAAGAIPTVLGAVLLAPAALSLTGRLAGRLPLVLRFAVRDADRQRGRTAPAVAAIAATVAGVVALGTAAGSDAEQNRLQYRPSGAPGVATVSVYGQDAPDYAVLAALARRTLPGEPVREVTGLPAPVFGRAEGLTEVQLCRASEQPQDGRCYELSGEHSSGYGSDLLVGRSGLSVLEGVVPSGSWQAAQRDLAQGRVLLTGPTVVPGEPVELRLTRFALGPDGRETATVLATAEATAGRLEVPPPAPVRAVIPEAVAEPLGRALVVGLVVGDDLTRAQEQELSGALRRVDENLAVRVERGYQDSGDRTVLLVLSLVAGSLVLAGTLAATSLALTEARPDLTTLGQVGARPRTRRAVAAGYALVLGVVGALLGVAAGLVPGVAAAVPLTRDYASSGFSPQGSSYVVVVPWPLLALLVVVLPLVAAAVAGLSARSGTAVARRVVG